ncbi:hypothetical protein KP509_05G095600 [Ceratopteris richardii]|nr:hypothetical protein KP509_05G095600 [Ceratopteris richardii]
MDFNQLHEAYERVCKKQKLCESQSDELFRKVTQEINAAIGKIHSQQDLEGFDVNHIYSELQTVLKDIRPMNEVMLAEKDLTTALAKYGKILDKQFTMDLANAYMDVDFDIHILNRVIATHFFRLGQFDLGECFLREANEEEVPLKSAFQEMHNILDQLKAHNLQPALVWAASNHNKLQEYGYSLLFDLHELQFVQFLQKEQRKEAIDYMRAFISPFAPSHMRQIQRLMCSTLFIGPRLDRSPYQDLFQSSNWDLISEQFTRCYCHLIGYSCQSALQVLISAGLQALPPIIKMVNIFGKERKHEWLRSKQLPLEIELGKEFQFHSIFACPVSKEQSTAENIPMLMPCGHVLCKQTIQRISKSRNFKCPYCPQEVNLADCKPLHF